jgi:predicted transcriptional regulator
MNDSSQRHQQQLMIEDFCSKYLNPTKHSRRLSILLSIHKAPHSSQHKIAKSTDLSSSMVNNYIKRLNEEGVITIAGKTNRTKSYHLTKYGQNELRESLLAYSSEIVQFYSSVKYEIKQILEGFYREGIRTLVLFGVAETAEVVFSALKDSQLVLISVVDSDPSKQGKLFNGLIVQEPEKLEEINPDAVVITSFGKQEEIYDRIRQLVGDKIIIKKLSDV